MKQAELAHVLNINQSDVSKIERGDKEPLISLFRDWTVKTNSADLGVAFLYGGTEVLMNVQRIAEVVGTTIAGFIWIGGFI
jgi:transcriptional regulator with XRE-family HTH domain